MNGYYNFNCQLEIVENYEDQEISMKTIKEACDKIVTNPHLPKQLHLLVDARTNGLKIDLQDIPAIVDAKGKIIGYFQLCKEAIVVKQPKDTALATLLSLGLRQINYQLKVFSTREAAIHWLQQ